MAKAAVTIIDHKINNLASITNACKALGMEVTIAQSAEALRGAGHVLLPGVGAFGASMKQLEKTGLDQAIREHVQQGNPILGICLGFQVLFQHGTESGGEPGLGLFQGSVDRFQTKLHVPHVGWNSVEFERKHPIFEGIESGTYMYFVHSYHPRKVDDAQVLARTTYGDTFTCAVAHGSAAGTQFHPEKSGAVGLRLLRNFTNWRP